MVEIGAAANGAKTYRFQVGTNKTAPYATVTAPEGGWKLGEENVFTVESDNDIACVVLVRQTDGTYKRVKAVTDANGTHSFTTSDLSENCEIVVAINGDINKDGSINVRDRLALAKGLLSSSNANYAALDDLQKKIGDVNGDGNLNVRDRLALAKGILSSSNENYQKIKW